MKKGKAIQIMCVKLENHQLITKKLGVNSFEEGLKIIKKLKTRKKWNLVKFC